jgi:hypothetical protein
MDVAKKGLNCPLIGTEPSERNDDDGPLLAKFSEECEEYFHFVPRMLSVALNQRVKKILPAEEDYSSAKKRKKI